MNELFNNTCQTIKETDVNLLIVIAVGFFTLLSTYLSLKSGRKSLKIVEKNEYYKIVYQKRFEAYEMVVTIQSNLTLLAGGSGEEYFMPTFNSWESYSKFYDMINNALRKDIWLSYATINQVVKLLRFLNENIPINVTLNDEKVTEKGIEHHKQLYRISSELDKILLKDLRHLYNIDDFVKSKSPSKLKLFVWRLKLKILNKPIDNNK